MARKIGPWMQQDTEGPEEIANLAKSAYPSTMRTVNIGELKNQLSAYLQYVRNGEEIIIRDRNTPVARILPIHADSLSEHEARLVASGAMTLPLEEMDWDAFFAEDVGNVPHDIAVQAAIEGRGDR
jgi:prevent-host-death family protein